MSEESEQITNIAVETEKPKKKAKWIPIGLPVDLIDRIDKVFKRVGYLSRPEYVRMAVIRQLQLDEHERDSEEAGRNVSDDSGSGESKQVDDEPGVQDNAEPGL